MAIPESRFWTVPNALSLSRLAILPVWWWVMTSPHISDVWGGVIIVYGMISDVLDGWLARRWGQETSWGKVLDPVGDKLAALVIGVFCVVHRDMPAGALLLTVGRDIALVVGGLILYRRSKSVPGSIYFGRYAALFWAITLLLYAFNWQPLAGWMLWPAVVLYLAAGGAYILRRA